jgi:hypothetical protein
VHDPAAFSDMTCFVLPQPGSHLVADVPRRVVPDQQHRGEPLRRLRRAAPGEQGGGLGADRAACPTPQQHWFGLGGDVTHHQANACGSGSVLGRAFSPQRTAGSSGAQVYSAGCARRLHQTASPKPSPYIGWVTANAISLRSCWVARAPHAGTLLAEVSQAKDTD